MSSSVLPEADDDDEVQRARTRRIHDKLIRIYLCHHPRQLFFFTLTQLTSLIDRANFLGPYHDKKMYYKKVAMAVACENLIKDSHEIQYPVLINTDRIRPINP